MKPEVKEWRERLWRQLSHWFSYTEFRVLLQNEELRKFWAKVFGTHEVVLSVHNGELEIYIPLRRSFFNSKRRCKLLEESLELINAIRDI